MANIIIKEFIIRKKRTGGLFPLRYCQSCDLLLLLFFSVKLLIDEILTHCTLLKPVDRPVPIIEVETFA